MCMSGVCIVFCMYFYASDVCIHVVTCVYARAVVVSVVCVYLGVYACDTHTCIHTQQTYTHAYTHTCIHTRHAYTHRLTMYACV